MAAEDHVDEEGVARLNERAAEGDRGAAQRYLSATLPYLRAVANRLVPAGVDPDDVLSEAIFRLLQKWDEGAGPREFAHTYVIRTIRNIVVDEIRAPRSRNVALRDDAPLADVVAAEKFRRIDLSSDFELVRTAMRALPDDQRRVLEAVVVNGRKPGEVSAQFQRNPAAVSNLLKRAKAALRRQVLVAALSEGELDCQRNATEVPRPPRLDWREHDRGETGIPHILGCEPCQRRWARWSGITSALGVSAALVVVSAVDVPSASAVDDTASESPHARRTGRGPGARRVSLAARRASLFVTLGTVTTGLTLAAVGATTLLTQDAAKPLAHLTVRATSPTVLALQFAVDAAQWRTEEISLTITGGEIRGIPQGWDCQTSAHTLTCVPEKGAIVRTFSVTPNGSADAIHYAVDVHATAGEFTVDGSARGTFPRSQP